MKKTILSTAIIATAFLAASCQKENLQENIAPEGSASVFTATIESGTNTKTTVERIDGTQATYKTKWESGDKISINGVTYSATPDGTDATKATFTKVSEASNPTPTYKAYFPANLYDETGPTLPANIEETWAEGKYNMPMYAESETTALEFKNLCGVLKVTVTSGQLASVKSITVSSTNCATSGKFTVSENKAVLTEASNIANTVTVTYTTAVSTDATGKVFYIAIPAQTYKNLSIAVSDGTTTKVMTTKKGQDITVARNTVYPISFDGILIAGTAKREGYIDVKWVQLWEDGPKFAEYNVGATSATDYGGYYAWGGNQDKVDDHNTGTDPLSGENDTATKLWGSNWRMPTQTELQWLIDNCTVEWTQVNSVNGCKFTGKGAYASNSVFLPAAGSCVGGNASSQGDLGDYWSSTPNSNYACDLYFLSGRQGVSSLSGRGCGYSVRAVLNETSLPEGALKGEFSVSATKKVRFSGGNLYAKKESGVWKWHFYDEQYQYNSLSTGISRTATAGDTEIDLFTWGYNATMSIVPAGKGAVEGHTINGESFDPAEDWGTQIGDGSTWRTLSTAEWQYLFNNRKNAASKVGYATVCGVNGLIILPDNFTDPMKNNGSGTFVPKSSKGWDKNVYTSGENWNAMETAGAVFLPAAGYRYGSDVYNVGLCGYYWSSTAYNGSNAYMVNYIANDVIPSNMNGRGSGTSVRLITDVN